MEIMKKIFESCVEDMRESVRQSHAYGGGMSANDKTVLRYSPKNWQSCPERLEQLRKQFIKRCRNSGIIFGNKREIADAFDEFLK